MKGINLKKIGAIVAGATILASSVAFAGGLMYQNTELVNENGEPLAKVILGAGSQAVDGVVSAAISNRMANEAYKSATLTAEVVGEATCSGSAEDCGTCDIVEGSETVTLEITVPGAGAEGVHEFVTAIGDYVDRGLLNRYTTIGDSDEGYTVFDDFEDDDANPFQNMLGFEMTFSDFDSTDLEQVAMYDIGAGNFGPFHEAVISDSKSGKEYKERQDVWIHGNNHWDEGDTEVYGEVDFMAYSALFDSTGDYGIPVCPGDESGAYGAGGVWACDDLDTLPAHRVYVSFMGEDWVISELENFWDNGCTVANATDQEVFAVDGSIVHLAKEAVSGIINVGEIMESPSGYKVRLDDISREVGQANSHPAIITVLDANDNEICQDQVFPGQTKDDLCDENTGVKLHVYQTAPGLNFIAKWAEMAIYKDEIELEDGNDFLDDSDTNWQVAIGWSVKGDDVCGYNNPEYLRNIILWTDEEEDEMEAGDVFPVVDLADYEVYDLTYNGIDDENADWDDLKFKVQTPSSNKTWDINDGLCEVWTTDAYVEVTTNYEFKVEYNSEAGAGTVRGDRAWYFDANNFDYLGTDCGAAGGNMWMILEDNDGENYFYDADTHGPNAGTMLPMKYKHAGSSAVVGFYSPSDTASGYMEGGLVHPAGKWDDPDSTIGDTISDALSMVFNTDIAGSGELGAWNYGTADMGDDDQITYVVLEESADGVVFDAVAPFDCHIALTGVDEPFNVLGYKSAIVYGGCGSLMDSHYDEGFISMRGTKFSSGSDNEYKFKVPNSVLKTTWTFSTVEAADSDPDTSTFTLHEGETAAVGTTGVSVHVLSIDQQLTPCSAGTGAGEAPSCTPDMSTVSAVIMPNNAPSVETIVPYSLTSNLVYLDTDNVALDTGVIITVGGDAVNTVTKDAIAGSDVDFEATPVVVKQIGNKIIVAGLTGPDTAAAGEQFLSELTN